MKHEIKSQKLFSALLCIALIICTVLTGGASWQYCIIPLFLLVVYIISFRKNITGTVDLIFPILLMTTGAIAITLTAGDKQNAMYEYEKMLCFVLAVFAGMCIKKDESVFRYILASAVLTAFVGLLAYCNFIRVEEFTFNDRYMVRLQSFLKYANTTALLLGCGYFAALELFHLHYKKPIAYLSSAVLIALYLTVSKAAIPIFLLCGTLFVWIERKHARYFILQNLICMLFTLLIILAGYQQWQTVQFLFIVICIAISGYMGTRDKNEQKKQYWVWLWLAGFIGFSLFACILFLIKNINILETLFRRFDYMKDALILLKDHWLTGIGPGAWKYYQYTAQTTQYNVTYIHNSWLQMWLEYGIIFFGTMLILLIKVLKRFYKSRQFSLLAITALILAHAFIDMDLSFGLILMILGLLTGVCLQNGKKIQWGKPIFYITMVWCCLILGYMTCEYTVRNAFERAYLQEDNPKAAQYAFMLEKLCPYDSHLQISLAALGQGKPGERIARALTLSPLDMQLKETEIEYAIAHGESSVLYKCKEYVEMASHQESVYTKAEEYAAQARNAGLCTQEAYQAFSEDIESIRKNANVIDRNELLDKIIEKN